MLKDIKENISYLNKDELINLKAHIQSLINVKLKSEQLVKELKSYTPSRNKIK